MGILLAIVSAIGVVVALLWRLNQASDAARGAMEAASDIRGMSRGFLWRRKANIHPMEKLDDPREAVVAMLAAVAEYDGPITPEEQTAILAQITGKFGASRRQAEEMLTHGRWMAKDVGDLASFLRRPMKLLRDGCDQEQKADIIAMLRKIASINGAGDDVVTNAIDQLARSLGN